MAKESLENDAQKLEHKLKIDLENLDQHQVLMGQLVREISVATISTMEDADKEKLLGKLTVIEKYGFDILKAGENLKKMTMEARAELNGYKPRETSGRTGSMMSQREDSGVYSTDSSLFPDIDPLIAHPTDPVNEYFDLQGKEEKESDA